jgi:hypothetical protein
LTHAILAKLFGKLPLEEEWPLSRDDVYVSGGEDMRLKLVGKLLEMLAHRHGREPFCACLASALF